MGKRKKVPNSIGAKQDRKQVRTEKQSTESKPSWRFSTVDLGGAFAWPKGKPEEADIIGYLHNFDGMYWEGIKGSSHHLISVNLLTIEAKKRLQDIQLDDIDELFSFRIGGKKRVFCIIDRYVAKLLWYDPRHEVCPSKLKHT